MGSVIVLKFNDDYETHKNEFGLEYAETDNNILKNRRQELGMTQQQVAEAAEIQIRQYQRLENGEQTVDSTSMRIGLSVCTILKLDPIRFSPILYKKKD